ncbi:MAG: S9 family peptidase [Nitrospirae bacterium]|nr:MAG: S9 family peptidase [Nitrospirota bacterium]
MTAPQISPYGSWQSPLTSSFIAGETIRLGQPILEGSTLYWLESRPTEGGRTVVIRLNPDGTHTCLTPSPFNVRTRVHEYGGGSYLVANGTVYFSNFADQRLYRHLPGETPRPITPDGPYLYADGVADPIRPRLLLIREDRTRSHRDPVNTIVSVPLDRQTTAGDILVAGHDFYAAPRISPDGHHMAWLAWNHPNMPWDGTELWIADVEWDGTLRDPRCLAGGPAESISQPQWSPDGVLHFVSDRTGWWNLYRWDGQETHPLCPMDAEFGEPQWVFGQSTYAFLSPERIICAYTKNGFWYLAGLEISAGTLQTFELPYTVFDSVRCGHGAAYCLASAPTHPQAVLRFDVDTQTVTVLRRSLNITIDEGHISTPEPLAYQTEHDHTAYGLLYKPKNAEYEGPPNDRPPLIVKCHGGPTGAAVPSFNLMIQFWTSRGFAVLDVNYGGSTGYGRAYRERLIGQWGIVDVEDCVHGVRYLANRGDIDLQRIAITGGSAGGFTVLCALTSAECFAAGSSYYGVSDLEALVRETHKFESHYLDRLVGPYPEHAEVYRARSPIHRIDRLTRPLILFQGLEDKVVPPNQAQMMFEAVKAKGLPVAYLAFEGEQHGFRKAETIQRVLDAELYFYSKIFRFVPADLLPPIPIENLS